MVFGIVHDLNFLVLLQPMVESRYTMTETTVVKLLKFTTDLQDW